MQYKYLRFLLLIILLSTYISGWSQESNDTTRTVNQVIDSLRKSGIIFYDSQKKPEIILSANQSVRFLQQQLHPQHWNDQGNPLRLALEQLIFEASHSKFDSSKKVLNNFPYDSLSIPWKNFYIWEPLRIKIPVIIQPAFVPQADTIAVIDTSKVPGIADTLKTRTMNIPNNLAGLHPVAGLKDTTIMVVIDTLDEVISSYHGFPFRYFNFPFQGDSIQVAVRSLLKFLEERDSTIISFTGPGNGITPLWINSKSDGMMRYWLKNEFSDSVTVWIGNPARNIIDLNLEKGISFRRPVRQGNYADAKINLKAIDNSKLLNVQKIDVKKQYWKYRSESSLVLSQGAVSNWVKGGENSISTAMDITGYADYNNKALKLSSNNFARLKLGFLQSGSDLRKNIDLLETNSKLNHKAFGKFDFSAIMLFKTQIASGYSYSKVKDKEIRTMVSKFMNPGILTIGFGLDYKPNKTTSINFSPLSYKGTFVLDPAYKDEKYDSSGIDQTKYGIAKNKRALNEPGASFMISNEYKPSKNVSITNRLQLFTNYIHNPLNVDIDWEMIAVINLNWFTDVRFNTHLIFDDDTKTVDLKSGSQNKTARVQFKELLGFSFVFRF
jgi:hypothetical protein